MSRPSSSAAVASSCSGRVTQRTATHDSSSTAASRIASVSSTRQGRLADSGGTWVSKVAQVPSCRRTWTRNATPCGGNRCMPGSGHRSAAWDPPCPGAASAGARVHGRRRCPLTVTRIGRSSPSARAAPSQNIAACGPAVAAGFLGGGSAIQRRPTIGGTLRIPTIRSRSAGTQRIQQVDDVGDPLRGLHAARPDQHAIALDEVDRRAQQLGDDQPRREHQHQPAEERAWQQAHHGCRVTSTART